MSKRHHDEFASDYHLQFECQQECECVLCFQADEEVSALSNFDLQHGLLGKRVCPGLPSQIELEDPLQDYDPLSNKIQSYELKEIERLQDHGYKPDDDEA